MHYTYLLYLHIPSNILGHVVCQIKPCCSLFHVSTFLLSWRQLHTPPLGCPPGSIPCSQTPFQYLPPASTPSPPSSSSLLTLPLLHDVDGPHEQLDAEVAGIALEEHGVAVAVLPHGHAAAAVGHPLGVQLRQRVLAVLEAVPLVPHHHRDRAVFWRMRSVINVRTE